MIREKLLSAAGRTFEASDETHDGEPLYVRFLTIGEQAVFAMHCRAGETDKSTAYLIRTGLCDETGAPLFTEEDEAVFEKAPAEFADKLARAVMTVNRLAPRDPNKSTVGEAAENF